MKTKPMEHQAEGAALMADNPKHFALACEQGTGKTWMLLADAERAWSEGRASGLFVVAPKGVHTNWVLREIPQHMEAETFAEYYVSGASKRKMRRLARLLEHDGDEFPVLAMNIDSMNTKKGRDIARAFMKRFNTTMVVDESQRIKNPQAARTKYTTALGRLAVSRRISSGTMIANSPLDAFGQFEFLREGLLGTTSYRAFVAEYAELLPESHPIVVAAAERSRGRNAPQIVATDENGRPRYRNTEKLSRLMAPYTFRKTKAECLDLPDKIYKTVFFELEPKQRAVYDQIVANKRAEFEDGRIDEYSALTIIGKLRQVTSGFIMSEGEAIELDENPARLRAFVETVEDLEGQFIVWAKHRAEIAAVVAALKKAGVSTVEYHGDISDSQRNEAIDQFQSGEVRAFVAQTDCGGTGLTLTAAQTAIYYSIDYNLDSRLQSEDRCHRIGTKQNVVYIDLCAVNTIDERIAAALVHKNATALEIMEGL